MIAERIERKIFRDSAPNRVNYVTPIAQDEAKGLVADVYNQMARDFQVAPPLTLHSSNPKLLAAIWAISRESLIAGPVNRTCREAVAAAVSKINECPFCVEIHTAMLHGGNDHATAKALLNGNLTDIPPSRNRSIAEWALATRTPNAEILRSPPFSTEEAPELIGTAVAFHYIDRMVNVFLDKSPIPVPLIPKWLKNPMGRVAGRLFCQRIIGLLVEPGESLPLLGEAELPADFSWAGENPAVSGAYARFAETLDEVGRSVVAEEVRDLVQTHVDSWSGEDLGISRRWVEEAIADLPASKQASGRLALLTAFAAYQVDQNVIKEFRQHAASDEQLIGTTAWASYVATRRVASWLHVPS